MLPKKPESGPDAYPGASVPWQYGWRFVVVLFTIFFGLFLSTLETTIVATALVSISSELGEFRLSNWIPVAYLITYTGFLMIFARMSDIFGRKQMLLFSTIFFMIFSAACGGAQSMVQLIVLRALQGAGGSGIYSCVMGSLREISPPGTFGRVTGTMGIIFALSGVVGPLLGGVIVAKATWRWIFLLNLPPCMVILVLLWFYYPSNIKVNSSKRESLQNIDWPGVVLSLAATTTLIYAMEAGSISQSWSDPGIITCLTLAGCFWIAFAIWEFYLERWANRIMPIFPVQILRNRVVSGSMLAGLFSGFAFFVVLINIPQRYIIVNGLSSTKAGINLIPLLIMSAFGAGSTGYVLARWPIDWYVMVASCAVQVVALGLLSSLSTVDRNVQAAEYGYEALLGLSFGCFNCCIMLIPRTQVGGTEQAVTIGAITQARTLGGVIGLSVGQVVLFNDLLSSLAGRISSTDLKSFFQSANALSSLPVDKVNLIKHQYAKAFSAQTRTIMYFTVIAFVACFIAWRRNILTFDQVMAARAREAEEQAKIPISSDNSSENIDKSEHCTLSRVDVEKAQVKCVANETAGTYTQIKGCVESPYDNRHDTTVQDHLRSQYRL